MQARPAIPGDADAVVRIYNYGIEERIATFETRARTAEEVRSWFGGRHPVVVVEEDGEVVAFAATSEYRPHGCYAGVAEFSVYADRAARGRGVGGTAMGALISAAERVGFWKLVSRVFVENAPSRKLLRAAGFREVGVYEKHARLDGAWKDVVIVERLLPSNLQRLVFGLGLAVSGMMNPAKAIGFLDVAGDWDPPLAFVMDGALLIAVLA